MRNMAESHLRRRKKESHEAAWGKLTPEQRLKRAATMSAAGLKLRDAGLAYLDKASLIRDAAKRPRRK